MPSSSCRRVLAALSSCWLLVACSSTRAGANALPASSQHAEIELVLEQLYAAFCFDANREADWETQRALFAPGAAFVAPFAPGSDPQAVDGERFLADFRAFILGSELGASGYHERIVHTRIDAFGTIAHAYVTFEGFVPGRDADRRGVDSLQLVRGKRGWLVASFTTQYESEGLPLPARFLRD